VYTARTRKLAIVDGVHDDAIRRRKQTGAPRQEVIPGKKQVQNLDRQRLRRHGADFISQQRFVEHRFRRVERYKYFVTELASLVFASIAAIAP
jgi:UDP-2,3-diacylglucosamine pyrophosphatase LpxH